MKKISIFLITSLVTLLAFNAPGLAQSSSDEEPWSKYPDNSKTEFEDANSFYDSLDKELYVEYKNAQLNIREKTNFKDINTILSKADINGYSSRHGGQGYHPNRQVYVFVTISKDGEKRKKAIFDAETKRPISLSSN